MNNNTLAIKAIHSIVDTVNFKGVLKPNLSREEDPTGQGRNRANLNKKIKVRLANALVDVVKLFKDIPATPRTESNISLNQDSFTVYDYEIPDPDLLQFEIQLIIYQWLLESQQSQQAIQQAEFKPIDFYSDDNVEEADNVGAQETARDLNQELIQAAIIGALAASMPRRIEPQVIVLDPEFRQDVENDKKAMYQQLKGLSDKTSKQVYDVMIEGMNGNKTKREIVKDIKRRFEVSESGAKRIVETEINKYNNNARMDVISLINKNTSLSVAGVHLSALLPTTRYWHGARHKKVYTAAQQRRWWDQGSNRINCHCSFTSILLNKKKKPLIKR